MEQQVKRGKIYKICDLNDSKRYIGSTCEKYLSNRLGGHRKGYRRWKAGKTAKVRSYDLFEEFGVDSCRIVLLDEFDFVSRDHLKAREAIFIQNLECVNKNIPNRSKEQWHADHPDYLKDYYQDNRNRLLNTTRCDCGGVYSISSKSGHKASKRHQRYEKKLADQVQT